VESSDRLTLEQRGHLLELTLTAPELLNRVDAALHAELHHLFDEVARIPDVRAMVFASTGKVFSAGGDMEFILAQHATADREETVREALAIMSAYLNIPFPVVIALQGDVMGFGTSLVLAADAVVSHPTARIADPHIAVGLAAGDGGCLVWPLSAGMLRAKRHLLTGDPLSGAEAYQAGLVTDLVAEPGDVLPAARALADRLCALPPVAVQGTKRALNNLVRHRFAEVMELSAQLEFDSLKSADIVEAVDAFRSRRPAVYDGS
jgi:enoyl-CoA hydratase